MRATEEEKLDGILDSMGMILNKLCVIVKDRGVRRLQPVHWSGHLCLIWSQEAY